MALRNGALSAGAGCVSNKANSGQAIGHANLAGLETQVKNPAQVED